MIYYIKIKYASAQLIVIDDEARNLRWGLVENVFVETGYRRQGIGTELMKEIETLAKSVGCKYIKLISYKEEGKALYRSLGYNEGSAFGRDLCVV